MKGASLVIPDGGCIECAKAIYAKEGWMGFWRGFSACTSRAIIANSFMFMAYDFAKQEYHEYME